MNTRSLSAIPVVLLAGLLLASTVPAAGPETRPAQPATAPAEPGNSEQGPVRFRAVDVYVDSGDEPLAAYQFDFAATAGNVKLVGLEGGGHPAFQPVPYYDPKALRNDRVIVAAFSTAADLPRGRSRVARLMVQVTGDVEATYAARLTAAATADGSPIQGEVVVTPVPEGARP